jgi:hypothetical protein
MKIYRKPTWVWALRKSHGHGQAPSLLAVPFQDSFHRVFFGQASAPLFPVWETPQSASKGDVSPEAVDVRERPARYVRHLGVSHWRWLVLAAIALIGLILVFS